MIPMPPADTPSRTCSCSAGLDRWRMTSTQRCAPGRVCFFFSKKKKRRKRWIDTEGQSMHAWRKQVPLPIIGPLSEEERDALQQTTERARLVASWLTGKCERRRRGRSLYEISFDRTRKGSASLFLFSPTSQNAPQGECGSAKADLTFPSVPSLLPQLKRLWTRSWMPVSKLIRLSRTLPQWANEMLHF